MSRKKGSQNLTTAKKKQAFIEALPKTYGIMEAACQMAQVPWSSVYFWMNRDKAFKDKVIQARLAGHETQVSISQCTLINRVKGMSVKKQMAFKIREKTKDGYTEKIEVVEIQEELPPDVRAAEIILNAHAKDIGYGKQSMDITTNGKDVVDNPINLSKLNADQKKEALKNLKELKKLGVLK